MVLVTRAGDRQSCQNDLSTTLTHLRSGATASSRSPCEFKVMLDTSSSLALTFCQVDLAKRFFTATDLRL
jgi:hypothetical protein